MTRFRFRLALPGERRASPARCRVLLLALAILLLGVSAAPASDCAPDPLIPPNLPTRSRAGKSVALDGGRLLVDAPNGGVAFVYRDEDGEWVLEARLTRASNSVARGELDGEHVLLGARGTAPLAYHLEDGTWQSAGALSPPRATGNSYGQTIALGDGFALVAEIEASVVEVFRFDAVSGWIHEAAIPNLVGPGTAFGFFLAIEGHTALIGAPNGGQVLVMKRDPDEPTWSVEATLAAEDGCDAFGAGLALRGDVAIVGSAAEFESNPCGSIYPFRRVDGEWTSEGVLRPDDLPAGHPFGFDVATDGETVIGGGSSFDPSFGVAAAWTRIDGEWVESFRLDAPGLDDGYGWGVAVEGDRVAVGSRQEALVYVTHIAAGLELQVATGPTDSGDDQSIRFDASKSTIPESVEIAEWSWDFGDGESSSVATTVDHRYASAGRYPAVLRVRTANGACKEVPVPVVVSCGDSDTAPWQSSDVGEPEFPGSARSLETEGSFEICAGGRGLSLRADEAHFVHQEFEGDFLVTMRVDEFLGDPARARIGLMVRSSNDPNSLFASVLVRADAGSSVPEWRFVWSRRTVDDAFAQSSTRGTMEASAIWLRLERRGNTVVGFGSSDGAEWTELDRGDFELPEGVLVGIVTVGGETISAAGFTAATARVSELSVAATATRFRRGLVNEDGEADLSDAVRILSTLFVGADPFPCEDAADVNDSGGVDLSDAVALLGHLFLGAGAPPAPFDACGTDATEDELGCEVEPDCVL